MIHKNSSQRLTAYITMTLGFTQAEPKINHYRLKTLYKPMVEALP